MNSLHLPKLDLPIQFLLNLKKLIIIIIVWDEEDIKDFQRKCEFWYEWE